LQNGVNRRPAPLPARNNCIEYFVWCCYRVRVRCWTLLSPCTVGTLVSHYISSSSTHIHPKLRVMDEPASVRRVRPRFNNRPSTPACALTPPLSLSLSRLPGAVFDVSIGIVIKLLANVANDPTNPKKRTIRLENAKIRQANTPQSPSCRPISTHLLSLLPFPALFCPNGVSICVCLPGRIRPSRWHGCHEGRRVY
jgi:hypothetical protein